MECPNCKETQWSAMDKKYLEIYGHCWSCDKKKWENKEMTTKEFEARENIALESCK